MFADSTKLIARLANAPKSNEKVTFLFGSALTASGAKPEDKGVPDVASMVERAIDLFRDTEEIETLKKELEYCDFASRYQTAMQFVLDCRGPAVLNRLVTDSVLQSCTVSPPNSEDIEKLTQNPAMWHLRPGVESAGQLIVEHPEIFRTPILTSNFDPLLEVSIRKASGGAASIFLDSDGVFDNLITPKLAQVVHFHGYWTGSDTLHTPMQLTRNRPKLKGCLRKLLRETTLVVMGYGGWNDVFTKTLVEVISEQNDELNVLWTFYSDNEETIQNSNRKLLDAFSPLVGMRVQFYKGVDCHLFLPQLRQRLNKSKPALQPQINGNVPIREKIEISQICDFPPQASAWVGRESELRLMLEADFKVAAITGIGGQGKSTLAAKFVELASPFGEPFFWDWRDCREESNTLHTQLIRIIERLTDGNVATSQLHSLTMDVVVRLFFHHLKNVKALFVFDNIDQYVNIEANHAIEGMDLLIKEALRIGHQAKFIFTSRPKLHYAHPSYLEIPLDGLSVEETQKLFEVREVNLDPTKARETIAEVQHLTKGHPLWLNLIATQVTKNRASLDELIRKIRLGTDEGVRSPMLQEIWKTLNEKQQTVLRYLAEAVRPETEQRVAIFLEEALNFNQFSKAVRTLKSLDLLVFKHPPNSPPTIELHPLVREFIRHQFAKSERDPYIARMIMFFDRMISKFRMALAADA